MRRAPSRDGLALNARKTPAPPGLAERAAVMSASKLSAGDADNANKTPISEDSVTKTRFEPDQGRA